MKKEVKATTKEVLIFFKDNNLASVQDLMNMFGYTFHGALSKLRRLEQQKLIKQLGTWVYTYSMTETGYSRLDYYEQRESMRSEPKP